MHPPLTHFPLFRTNLSTFSRVSQTSSRTRANMATSRGPPASSSVLMVGPNFRSRSTCVQIRKCEASVLIMNWNVRMGLIQLHRWIYTILYNTHLTLSSYIHMLKGCCHLKRTPIPTSFFRVGKKIGCGNFGELRLGKVMQVSPYCLVHSNY